MSDLVEVRAVKVRPGAVRWRRVDNGREFTLDPDDDVLVEEWLDGDALRFYLPPCPGHESTSGPAGISSYCDGSCQVAS